MIRYVHYLIVHCLQKRMFEETNATKMRVLNIQVTAVTATAIMITVITITWSQVPTPLIIIGRYLKLA